VANSKNNLSKAAKDRLKNYEVKNALVSDTKSVKKRDNSVAIVVSIASIVVAVGLQFAYFNFGPGTPKPSAGPTSSAIQTNSPNVPKPALAENRLWSGDMKIDNSNLKFSLDGKLAPQAVANFVTLAKKGFFNNTHCHRLVISGIYVLQCGDPTATGKVKSGGTGGPGYSWGPLENVPLDDIYKTGSLAMARTGNNAYSMGSQFFIVYEDSTIPRDNVGGYTVFGKVTSGIRSIVDIAANGVKDLQADGTHATDGTPVSPAIIKSVVVK